MNSEDNAREERPPNALEVSSSCSQLDQVRARILTDLAVQEKLREADDTDRFIALVLETARDCSVDLSAEDVRAAMRVRLPGADGLIGGGLSETPLPPEGYLPVGASWQPPQLYVHWSHFGEQRLREPFYEGNVQRRLAKPFNRVFGYSTPITKLADWLHARPGLRPSGFIFHMSRCGSTLVAQMLAACASNVVISEASPIDAVVRARHLRPDLEPGQHALWLTWMIRALGQPRSGGERNYFIKLDCWHTLALPLFRQAFPEVPWVFLYRDPVEVLVSQHRMPGLQMIPGMLGPDLFGIEASAGLQGREDYCARVLARICEPVLQQYSKGTGLLVNYRQLPQAVWTTIMPHFGVGCSDGDRAAMTEVARYDAKTPSFRFMPDIAAKQQDATATMRSVADERLGELYRRLESMRLGS